MKFEMPVSDSEGIQATKCRSRMKKVAPPPPPIASATSMKQPLSNGSVLRRPMSTPSSGVPRPASMSSCTPGEDCAFDELLEGRMEIEVVLPDLKIVRMTVDRRTPMMDLLVQATTANKISPGGHIINVVSKEDRNVQYKPNTPIGSLDTNIVYIVPKAAVDIPVKRMPKLPNQPFEQQTFRLQVNLPRNQRMVLRVSPRITLAELKRQICYEKELDHSNHHLVHPAQPDTILDLNSTLEVYGCAEISLMSNSGLRDSIRCTSTNLIAYPRSEEEKKKKGILRLFSRKKKEIPVDTSSNGIDSRGVSPTRSEMSVQGSYQPKQSTKRKPAPAPPTPVHPPSPPLVIQSSSSLNSRPDSEISAKTDEAGSTVSHSRHSSDSSGYHEPSVFSDCSENKSPEASIVHGGNVISVQDNLSSKDVIDNVMLTKRISTPSKDPSNLKTVPSCSSTSVSATRKRKAPQPPAPVLHEVETPPSPEQPADSPLAVSSQRELHNAVNSIDSEEAEHLQTSTTSEVLSKDKAAILNQDASPSQPVETSKNAPAAVNGTENLEPSASSQQESEALKYLEKVLHESESSNVISTDGLHEMEKSSVDTEIKSHIDKSFDAEQPCVNHKDTEEYTEEKNSVESLTHASPVPLANHPSVNPPPEQHSSPEEILIEDNEANSFRNLNKLPQIPSSSTSLSSLHSEPESLHNNDVEQLERTSANSDASEMPVVPSNEDALTLQEEPDIVDHINSTNETAKDLQPTSSEIKPANLVAGTDGIDSVSSVETDAVKDISQVETVLTDFNETEGTDSAAPVNFANGNTISEEIEEFHLASKSEIKEVPSHSKEIIKNSELKQISENTNIVESEIPVNVTPHEVNLTPSTNRKLINFALSCYKNEEKDIFSVPSPEESNGDEMIAKTEAKENEITLINCKKSAPNVKIVPFEERLEQENSLDAPMKAIKGQVQQRREQLVSMATMPLTGRSASLFNLTPQKKRPETVPLPTDLVETPEGLKKAQSDQNLSQDKSVLDEKSDLVQEQKRLHEEYLKLQAQFISWQKQLLNNQSLLQNEQIMPQLSLPAFGNLKVQLDALPCNTQQSNTSLHSTVSEPSPEEFKTRSLPRPKPCSLPLTETIRPITPPLYSGVKAKTFVVTADINPVAEARRQESKIPSQGKLPSNSSNSSENLEKCSTSSSADDSRALTLPRQIARPSSAQETSRTMTLNRHTRPKSQAVSVTIGSWQQRNEALPDIDSASVASSRSMFQSLENIPQAHHKIAPHAVERKKTPSPSALDRKTTSHSRQSPTTANVPETIEVQVHSSPVREQSKDGELRSQRGLSKSSTNSAEIKTIQTKPSGPVERNSVNTTESQKNRVKSESQTQEKINVKAPDVQKHAKSETKHTVHETAVHSKFTKPLVRLISMKDEMRPPQIQGLKKWPLSEISEKGERSVIGPHEKIHRAEVDLRKHRAQKGEPTSAVKPETAVTSKQQTSVKSKIELSSSHKSTDDTQMQKNVPETSVQKLHITKVSINGNDKVVSSHSTSGPKIDKHKAKSPSTPSSGSEPLNSELMNLFAKRSAALKSPSKTTVEVNHKPINSSENKTVSEKNQPKSPTVNGNESSPPPPPPMPNSSMPVIPPAAPIPMSSQLLMDSKNKRSSSKQEKSQPKVTSSKDPREELMLEIRGFGGRQALRKVPTVQAGWNLKVYGSASTTNS